MIVRDYMTTGVKSCTADTDLGTVATMMWDGDCGVVPVINDDQNVVGMITDRDICIAAATRGTSPSTIRVRDVMSAKYATRAARRHARPSARRSRAISRALRREGRRAASRTSLARQARSAPRRRSARSRSAAARKAAQTRQRARA